MRLLVVSCAGVLAALALTSAACETSSVSGLGSAGGGGEASSATGGATGAGGGQDVGAGGAPWTGPTTPLYMTHATLTDGLTVHVTFSEPVIVPAAIDPTDFRLAATVLQHEGVPSCTNCGDQFEYYCFPHQQPCDGYGVPYTPVRDLSLYEDVGAVFGVAANGDGLDLQLSRGLPYDASIGLSLHYAPGSAPITDAAGDAPSAAGPAWVRDTESSIQVPGFLAEGALRVDNHILRHYKQSASSCGDGVVDSTETDVDCGGTTDPDTYGSDDPGWTLCARCDSGKHCLADSDCQSSICTLGACAVPTCSDGVQNQGELAVDCGSADGCPACPDGTTCNVAADCASGACAPKVYDAPNLPLGAVVLGCGAPSCHDGVEDGTESDVDCGGVCGSCIGATCVADGACASGTCNGGVCAPTPVVAASIGALDTCAVTAAGAALCWGINADGEVGDGTTAPRLAPVATPALGALKSVSMSAYFGCAVTITGGVVCWGAGDHGQNGSATLQASTTPISISGLSAGVSAVSAGLWHACALTTAGGVQCWGANDYGELGDGTTTASPTPVPVQGLASGVVALGAGNEFSCALTTTGGVKCWGRGLNGALGAGAPDKASRPIDVAGLGSGVASLWVGSTGSCARKTAGGLVCWGVLGAPTSLAGSTADVVDVAVGNQFACARSSVGAVSCWGVASSGGDGRLSNLGDDGMTAIANDPVAVIGLPEPAVAIAAGWAGACAISATGALRCWGSEGFLGDGTSNPASTAVPVYGLSPP